MHCTWTRCDLTDPFIIIPNLSSFHTDTHNTGPRRQQHRRWRSTAFGKCITSEHGETWLNHLWLFLFYPRFTQRLTTLDLEGNNIGPQGAQHLASALQANKVRLDWAIYQYSYSIFISHRYSQRWILESTTSALKEHNILQLHCEWTQWDLTEHLWLFVFYPHFTQTLTTLDLRWNKIGAEGAQHLASALQVNKVRLDCVIYDHYSSILITHRHSQRWILESTTSVLKEHSI